MPTDLPRIAARRRVALVDPGDFTPPYDAALACGLAAAGAEVKLIGHVGAASVGAPGLHEEWFYHLSGRPCRSSVPKFAAGLLKGVEHASDMVRLTQELRSRATDVVHFQWLPIPLIDHRQLKRIGAFAPTVITVHDNRPYNGAGRLAMRLGYGRLLHAADALIVHTAGACAQLTESGHAANRVHLVPHGLLHQVVNGAEHQKEPKSNRPLQLLLFGKLKPYKGVDVFLQALGQLQPESRKRIKARIVGEPYMPTDPLWDLIARQGLESVVELRLDFVPEAELNALFAAADAVICPYRAIDASGVAMIAMAQGVRLVASNIGIFTEKFAGGGAALLVPPGEPGSLAAALTRLLTEPDLLNRLRRGMLAKRAIVPSWERIGDLTMAVYDAADRNWRRRRRAAAAAWQLDAAQHKHKRETKSELRRTNQPVPVP